MDAEWCQAIGTGLLSESGDPKKTNPEEIYSNGNILISIMIQIDTKRKKQTVHILNWVYSFFPVKCITYMYVCAYKLK